MGASGKIWLTCRMEEQHYNDLELHSHPEIQIVSIEPEFDYSKDEEWQEFKREANKAYKLKKERELYLRSKED